MSKIRNRGFSALLDGKEEKGCYDGSVPTRGAGRIGKSGRDVTGPGDGYSGGHKARFKLDALV